jgi:hypothetical protein
VDRQRGRFTREDAQKELERRGLWGYVEPILTMGSAAFAEPVSGLMGLAALPYGSDASARAIANTQEALTYQPRTKQGIESLQDLGEFMQPVGDAFIGASEYLGDAAYNATGSPALGAAAYSVPTMALEALGLKGARYASKGRAAYEMGDIGKQGSQFGGKQRGIFAGVKAKGADLKQMEAAQELANRGVSRDEIWSKTGWFEDVDGKWKWEIDDSSTMTKQIQSRGSMRLPEVLEHDALYAAYPSTRMLSISRGKNGNYYSPQLDTMRVSRVESPANDIIRKYNRLEDDLLEEAHAKLERGEFNDVMEAKLEQDIKELSQRAKEEASAYSGDAFEKKTVMHELQHALQEREGFAKGGHAEHFADDYNRALHNKDYYDQEAINARLAARKTPEYKAIQSDIDAAIELDDKVSLQKLVPQRRAIEDAAARDFELESARLSEKIKLNPFEQYRRLAGEAEARNVETRLDFTPEQRRATPPWKTLDVPEDELIVRRGNGVMQSNNGFLKEYDPAELVATELDGKDLSGGYKGDANKPILTVVDEGRVKILDGHHRAKLAAKEGRKVKAIDLPYEDYLQLRDKGIHPAEMQREWIASGAYEKARDR